MLNYGGGSKRNTRNNYEYGSSGYGNQYPSDNRYNHYQSQNIHEFTNQPNYGQAFYGQRNTESAGNSQQLKYSLQQQQMRHSQLLDRLRQLEIENQELKRGKVQGGGGTRLNPNAQNQLQQRIIELKSDNEELRKFTINLLKKGKY